MARSEQGKGALAVVGVLSLRLTVGTISRTEGGGVKHTDSQVLRKA